MWETLRGDGFLGGGGLEPLQERQDLPRDPAVRDASQAIVGFVSVFSDIIALRT